MLREDLRNLIEKTIAKLYGQTVRVGLERPAEASFGDYATNAALILKKDPAEVAAALKSEAFERIEVKNGFINFFVAKDYLQKQVAEILKKKEKFGNLKIGRGQKVNVEFVSANPTGPLTLGNGRGGFCGDVLANILAGAGFRVSREYYVNDRGEQVIKLGHSVIGDEEAVYKGPYVEELRKKVKIDNPKETGERAAKVILEEMIRPAIEKMGIEFDVWFSEKNLYRKKEIGKVLTYLKSRDLVYENDGALWFKSTRFGDDKDRVLLKAGGEETYFLSDIAYLKNKFRRGFEKLIFFWGADHYGYVGRLKAAAEALGFEKEKIDIVVMQLVRLFEGGREVRMSKRTGIYLTIDELIDEVGRDAARFFFLQRSPDTHLNFNLDLAKEQSENNPVYYVQYAHARICSILEKLRDQKLKVEAGTKSLKLLGHQSELTLIKQLIRLPEIIEDTSADFQVQRLPQYTVDLATAFHQFYRDCRVIDPSNEDLQSARISLVLATRIILKRTLSLMGLSAPEKM
ncbi:MAG: arginine--tRNA ligase [Candidatus Nealsonbacteria bacterium]|nr:arginine--tRNA ligase [Candidatus Nealsonbacteria bacterium]